MKRKFIAILLVSMMFTGLAVAQQNTETKQQNIFDALATNDSVSHASVTIHQDKRIEILMAGKNGKSHETASGYRVQVFSSNTQKTAKGDAFRIEKLLQDQFPGETVYVNYTSPFWKVRVGDFKTMTEAQTFRSQIISAFPTMRSETYVVKEQINTTGSN